VVVGERGAVRKEWGGRVRVCLFYPGSYRSGMSSLGFLLLYRIINALPHALCERAFIPEGRERPVTIESGRSPGEFDVIAFSLSYELDYVKMVEALLRCGIHPLAEGRKEGPLIVAGGIAPTMNPEPIGPFLDAVMIGEGEEIVGALVEAIGEGKRKEDVIERLSHFPGVYIPQKGQGTRRAWIKDLEGLPGCSSLTTPRTEFGETILTEVVRGCGWRCRFCGARHSFSPPRFRWASLVDALEEAKRRKVRVGLVGSSVAGHPRLKEFCRLALEQGVKLAFASLRVDELDQELLQAIVQGGQRTVSYGVEAGSMFLRRKINKMIPEEVLVDKARLIAQSGVPNQKLYFMIGLPEEKDEDVAAIVRLAKSMRDAMLEGGRKRGNVGRMTVSLNPFIPKASTPMQWYAMAPPERLWEVVGRVKDELKGERNLLVRAASVEESFVQAAFSVGDRHLAPVILEAAERRWTPKKLVRKKGEVLSLYALRARREDTHLPWDHIDSGVRRDYLLEEKHRMEELSRSECKE